MATYSVQAASPPAFITAHSYVSPHRAQFDTYDPPVATALPSTNGHRPNQGSDCGSSSGLGGMKQEGGVSDDSASNHDGGSEDMAACIDVVPVSSKESAASSGKGSSTGTSPTGGPTRPVNSVKARSSPKRQRTPLHIQATPSTSAAAASDVLTLGAPTTGSTASGSVVSLNGSTDYAATVTPAYPPPMSVYPRLIPAVPNHPPPPLYTMTVSSAGQIDICQNRPTTNGGPAGAPLHSNGQPSANGPMTSSGTSTAAATTGQNASAASSTTGGRNSASPGDGVAQSQPAGPVSSGPQRTSNDLYVHVQPGETLAIRVGSDIQQISGPATVRMVSQNGHPPSALPLHVPPGHMIQQIVDELGNLRHVILSPETTPTGLMPNGPFGVPIASTPVPPPPTINPNTPVPPSGTPTPQYHACIQQAASPPPGVPPFPPPVMAAMPFVGHQVVGVDLDPQHVCSTVYDPAGYPHPFVQVRTNHWSPPPGTISRSGKFQDAGYGDDPDASQNSQSGASCVEDEETEKIKDMLNRIQSPQVLEAGSREAEISWQELDTSEASAPGGPFPQIDPSEFTYEIVLFEGKPDGRVFSNYRCTPDQGNQLRLCHLKPDTEYFVRLRALLAERGLLGEQSAPIGFKTKPTHPDKPLPPRLLKCGKSWFQLSWKKPSDNGSRISEFLLEMDEVREGAKESFKEAYRGLLESSRVNHLQPNTLYRFRLTASNEYGQSEPSDILLMQTKGAAPTAPNPPQLLDATPTSLRVAWTKRESDDHFSLQMEDPRSDYGFLPYIANTCETVTTVSDLQRNSEYRFRLTASNDDGQSPPSEAVAFSTLPDRPNAPPKPQLKDVVKATSVALVWDPPKDTGGAEVTSYQLEYMADQVASPNVDPRTWKSVYCGSNRGVAVHGLEPGQSYKFRLGACGPAGQSSWSDSLDVSTTPIVPAACSRPELVGRTKSTSIHIRWTPPSTTGGAPVTEYEVAMRDSQIVYRGPKTDCQINGLLPGRLCFIRVRAYNRTGHGAWSEPLETTTAAGAPDAPTDLRLVGAAGDKTLTLTWNAPQETNGAPITEYRLLRATRRSISLAVPDEETLAERRASVVSATAGAVKSSSSSDSSSVPATPTGPLAEFGEFSVVHTGAALTAEVKNLTPATDFAFKVLSVNASGVSAPSRELICRTVAGPPSAPTKVTVEAVGMTELDVNWEEPSGNGSPLIAYLIELSSDVDRRSLAPIQLPAHINQHLIDDLLPETLYRVRVSATNDVGSGPWATATCSTFSMPPPPPTLECVNVGAQSLKLRWHDTKNPVGDEKYYYYVEKENENGSYSPVFEGDSKSVKAKNLNECTRYRFRVRASSPTGGMGPWSEPVEFATSRLPPPSVKLAPRVTEVTEGSYQIEWQAIRAAGLQTTDKIQYRLQTAIGSSRGGDRPEDWKTVYQGSALSYTLSGQAPGTSLRVRVSSVRQSQEGGAVEETVAPPSPFATINQPATPTKQQRWSESAGTTSEGASSETEEAVEPKLSDGHYAILILVGFSLLALLLAFFAQSFMGGSSS